MYPLECKKVFNFFHSCIFIICKQIVLCFNKIKHIFLGRKKWYLMPFSIFLFFYSIFLSHIFFYLIRYIIKLSQFVSKTYKIFIISNIIHHLSSLAGYA